MEISLNELLEAREERVRIQNRMREENPHPLICFTMNIAGPTKTSPIIERAFRWGLKELDEKLLKYGVSAKRIDYQKCGPTAYYSVKGGAEEIKNICVGIEESCPMGRLFDMDVIGVDGKKLERESERCCIICNAPGRACAAGRIHSVEELQKKTEELIFGHFIKKDCEKLSDIAKSCLLKEVETTPKPGLVDLSNNGSHSDMTVSTFEKSAEALRSYFYDCADIGIETARSSAEETFVLLRNRGIKAEKEMYEATGGVNTHKGIIYSMGIVLGAIGRLWRAERPIADIEMVFAECSALSKGAAEVDFCNINGSTAGGRMYMLNGQRGIRGEASNGFPSVKNIALPIYESALESGKNQNDAGVLALVHLMANIYDTSVFNRGGEEGVSYVRECAKKAIESDDVIEYAKKMDERFIEKNLSPGGAADLLAITYFIRSVREGF